MAGIGLKLMVSGSMTSQSWVTSIIMTDVSASFGIWQLDKLKMGTKARDIFFKVYPGS